MLLKPGKTINKHYCLQLHIWPTSEYRPVAISTRPNGPAVQQPTSRPPNWPSSHPSGPKGSPVTVGSYRLSISSDQHRTAGRPFRGNKNRRLPAWNPSPFFLSPRYSCNAVLRRWGGAVCGQRARRRRGAVPPGTRPRPSLPARFLCSLFPLPLLP
jgi:hypothetical protein